ncbi:BPSL0761 family protein [Burkholderia sp. PU8-34]
MTIPIERTRAVLRTRQFLEELTSATSSADLSGVRLRAESLLRHYPTVSDLSLSATALPLIWADPLAR